MIEKLSGKRMSMGSVSSYVGLNYLSRSHRRPWPVLFIQQTESANIAALALIAP
jgi:hypothetical protein